MQFEGALLTEQRVTFGIVVVKRHVLQSQSAKQQMRVFGARAFGPVPIILMAQDAHGVPTFDGRKDIAQFLASVDPDRIPWQRYTLTAA